MSTKTSADRIYRAALLAESALNTLSIIPMLLAPDAVLDFVATSPAQPTALARSLLQWAAALVNLATLSLLLAYPNPSDPTSSTSRAATLGRRKLAYEVVALSEPMLALVFLWQYLQGGSGIKDGFLLTAAGMVGGLGFVRAWVVLNKSEWMEPPAGGERKSK